MQGTAKPACTSLVSASTGEATWKAVRKGISPAFAQSNVRCAPPTAHRGCKYYFWHYARRRWELGKPCMMSQLLQKTMGVLQNGGKVLCSGVQTPLQDLRIASHHEGTGCRYSVQGGLRDQHSNSLPPSRNTGCAWVDRGTGHGRSHAGGPLHVCMLFDMPQCASQILEDRQEPVSCGQGLGSAYCVCTTSPYAMAPGDDISRTGGMSQSTEGKACVCRMQPLM